MGDEEEADAVPARDLAAAAAIERRLTVRPRNVPLTWATCGPPKICVHIVLGGTGANGAFSAASFVHALAARGRVPPAGPQVRVAWRVAPPFPGETAIVRAVAATTAASIATMVGG